MLSAVSVACVSVETHDTSVKQYDIASVTNLMVQSGKFFTIRNVLFLPDV